MRVWAGVFIAPALNFLGALYAVLRRYFSILGSSISETDSLAAINKSSYELMARFRMYHWFDREDRALSKEDDIRPATTLVVSTDPAEDELRLQIDLRMSLDKITALENEELRSLPRPAPTHRDLVALARRIYDARRTRHRVFSQKIFGEPAWDMLLALYSFPSHGEVLTVTSLAHAAGVPTTTGYRWQLSLTEHNLIERGPKGPDGRMQFIGLTQLGRELIEKYLTRLYYADVRHPPWAG